MTTAFAESSIYDVLGLMLDTVGGAQFQTNIIEVQSGYEQRNQNWSQSRGQWDIGERVLTLTELTNLNNFFRARKGRFQGFRFKDWSDYTATITTGKIGTTGLGTGQASYQLYKNYTDATSSDTYQRKIAKPVTGTVQAYLNGSPTASSVDTTTGIITLTPKTTKTITNITKAASGVVTTSAAHGLGDHDVVFISGVSGMTQVNNLYFDILVISATTFSIQTNTSSYGTYTSGGSVSIYPQAADAIVWAGQFDVPVRFDSDQVKYRMEALINGATPYFYVLSLPLVELRI